MRIMAIKVPCCDRELAEGVVRNDHACVAAFFAAYHSGVFRYLLCLCGSREDAEDLAQETLLQAHAKIRSFRGESALKTWVHRIAFHTFTHWHRRRRPSSALDLDIPEPNQAADAVDAAAAVLSALRRLGTALAHPFVLQEINGHTVDEIARILDIPAGTVKSRLHAAKHRLRELLGSKEDYLA